MRYVWFIKFGVRIVGRYLYATAIAEVRSFAGTRHHVRGLMGHVVARLGIILFDDLEAAGAALRAMLLPPLFDLDIGPLRTLNIGMPGALAADAPAVGTIRALHHRIPISR